jgi:hypothetical protein
MFFLVQIKFYSIGMNNDNLFLSQRS